MADRIGITGATGFVGGALVESLLAEGAELRLFGREAASVRGLPVRPFRAAPEDFAGLDCVVHLAGITTSRASAEALRQANVDLAVETARAAAAAGVRRFVFLSSLHVHGKSAGEAVRPDSPLNADNAYGRSKAEAEGALRAVAEETGLELVILRPPMIYGRDGKGSFQLLARLVRSGLPLPFGRARGRRSFCSIENLVSAIRRAIRGPARPEALIPADPDDFDTPELVRAMAGALNRPARLFAFPRALLTLPLALVGRAEMIVSLFDPLRVDRAHWAAWGWAPEQPGSDAVRAAVAAPDEAAPLIIYVTNTTPYFFSHRIALAREARRRGFRIALAGGDVDEHLDLLAAEGIQPVRISTVARGVSPVGDLRASRALAAAIRRLRPAAVHASGLKVMFLCALAGFQVRLPKVVCIVTGLGTTYINDDLKARVIRLGIEAALRPLLRRSRTAAVFQNGDDRAYFLKHRVAREDNSLVIKGSGVDPAEYPATPEPADRPVLVVFPARLLLSKGVREFVEAAAMLHRRGVHARFALVGDLDPANPDALTEGELAAFVERGDVEVQGFRRDMARVFAECHLVCLPSYREGVPKALIEAASSGRAIVSTDVPGCREIVVDGQNGLLAPVRDAVALAAALETLILDAERRQAMGRAGRALVEAEFSTAVVIGRTADLYGDASRRD